jgi:hypothetical protein
MATRSYSTGNVLSCVAFSHGKGPRSITEVIPLVQFMSHENSLKLLVDPETLMMWTVVCGVELEKQHAKILKKIKWPDWDAEDDALRAWYEEHMKKLGRNLTVEAFPEGSTFPDVLEGIDVQVVMRLEDTVNQIRQRLTR